MSDGRAKDIRAAEERYRRIGLAVIKFNQWLQDNAADGFRVTEIRVKSGDHQGDGMVVIVKAFDGVNRRIAFQSCEDFDEGLVGACNRILNDSIKWREDVPYGQRGKEG